MSNILGDGRLASQAQVEEYLLRAIGTDHSDLFKSDEERLDEAYRAQTTKVAFRLTEGLTQNQDTDEQ